MDEKKTYDNEYQIKIGEYNGRKSGSGVWANGLAFYLGNIRLHETGMCADIDVKTAETYLNKKGELKNKYVQRGFVTWNPDSAHIILEVEDGVVINKDGVSRLVEPKPGQDFTPFRILDFREREPNKYEKMTFTSEIVGSIDDIPDVF